MQMEIKSKQMIKQSSGLAELRAIQMDKLITASQVKGLFLQQACMSTCWPCVHPLLEGWCWLS